MLEGELESAICRCYPQLLPDLHKAGYQLSAQQAVLLGRRMDLLLRRGTDEACIIELKVGAPPMPGVRNQILDYRTCWLSSFPETSHLRLMVISDVMPEHTAAELGNFGIETRTITAAQAATALEAHPQAATVPKSPVLEPSDTERVRHLLSDYDAIATPASLTLGPPWNHEKVFLALVQRGERHKDLWKKNIYVRMYPQSVNCAVLYGPKVKVTEIGPVHLNPRAKSWRQDIFERIKPALKYRHSDNKGPGRESTNFDWYEVVDWGRLAEGLGLS